MNPSVSLIRITVLLGCFTGLATAENLAAVVGAVLTHNAGLKATQARSDAAKSHLREARAQRLPALSARAAWTRGDNPVYVFGSLLEQGQFGPANFAIDSLNNPSEISNIKGALDLGLPLFTGYEITSAVRVGEEAVTQAASGHQAAAQQLRYEAATLYLQLLHDQQVMKRLDERIASSTREVDSARKLRERGLLLGSDYYAAEAILSGLKSWKMQIDTGRSAAAARLAILSGQPEIQAQGALSTPTYSLPSQDECVRSAVTRRPDIRIASSQASMAETETAQAGRSILPKIKAFATLETNTEDFSSSPSNHLYGVSAQLPFGDPGYFSRRDRAAASVEAARQSQAHLEERARAEVAQAYRLYQGALANLPSAEETRERAAKSLELFRPQYQAGRQSILDVLRAEEGLAKAEAAYAALLFQSHAAYLQLLAASGGLDDTAVQTVSAQVGGPS